MEPINPLHEFLRNIIRQGYAILQDDDYFKLKHNSYILDTDKNLKYSKFSIKYNQFIYTEPYGGNILFCDINQENLIVDYGEPIHQEDIDIIF